MSSSYTILTVFENAGAINEPVISLPLAGKVSFRQVGFLVALSMMLPLAIYSVSSEYILHSMPEPVFSFGAVNTEMRVTWDIVLSMVPVPAGLVLGLMRPKLVPMDVLAITILRFMIRRTSLRMIRDAGADKGYTEKPRGRGKRRGRLAKKDSRFAGFARPYRADPSLPRKKTYTITVTEFGVPKNMTVTLYDMEGNPMRSRLARAYIDDVLQCSITTDPDGTLGMTFVPKTEGRKILKVIVDGIADPVVDAVLEIKRHG